MHGQFGMLEPAISQCAIMLHASRLAKESSSHDAKPTQVLSSPCVWEIRTECQQQKKRLPSVNSRSAKLFSYATTTRELLQPSNVSPFLVFDCFRLGTRAWLWECPQHWHWVSYPQHLRKAWSAKKLQWRRSQSKSTLLPSPWISATLWHFRTSSLRKSWLKRK